jgi:hypothetical protein
MLQSIAIVSILCIATLRVVNKLKTSNMDAPSKSHPSIPVQNHSFLFIVIFPFYVYVHRCGVVRHACRKRSAASRQLRTSNDYFLLKIKILRNVNVDLTNKIRNCVETAVSRRCVYLFAKSERRLSAQHFLSAPTFSSAFK